MVWVSVPPLATPDRPLGIAGLVCPRRGRRDGDCRCDVPQDRLPAVTENPALAKPVPPVRSGPPGLGQQRGTSARGRRARGGWTARAVGARAGAGGGRRKDAAERRVEGRKQLNQGTWPGPPYRLQAPPGRDGLNRPAEGPACLRGCSQLPRSPAAPFQGKPTPTQQAFQGEAPGAAQVSEKGHEDKERSNRAQQKSLVPSNRTNGAGHGLPEAPTF